MLPEKSNMDDKLKFKKGPTTKIVKEKNKLKKSGINIIPNGINILNVSSKVRELIIQCIPLKKKLNPKIVPKTNKFFLKGFFLYLLFDLFLM